MSDLDCVVKEFLIESRENLDALDNDLLALEKAPRDPEKLASIFRTIHTIKGTSGCLGFTRLGAVTHAGEGLLSRLRDGHLHLTPELTSALLALVDAVRTMLAGIEANGSDGDADYADLIARLTRWQTAAPTAPAGAPASEPTAEAPDDSATMQTLAASADGTIRVDVGLLDRLMNLVGELVLVRNQIMQSTAKLEGSGLCGDAQRLDRITTELQGSVMKTRMQPISKIGKTFPRLVRDLAVTCGKHVRIDLEGEETELDKTVLEAVKGPLTHLVRNAVDHGIEPPAARARAGKPAEGRLLLRAYHEGGQVNIEISDDGGGIDTARVRQKALSRGLITPEQAAGMSERELLALIFVPGLSTAEKITSVSGRGVGMDVVKTNIEKIGGGVEVQSRAGQGTTVKMKIPLTLAIIPALIVSAAGDRYAIPQASLVELVRLEAEQARRAIEHIHGAPVYRLRGNLLPLVYLDRELGVEAPAVRREDVYIVVLTADGRPFGLVVDAVNDTEEIVVKPLSKLLEGTALFAGATIMGDGRVALILDVSGVARAAGVIGETRGRPDGRGGTGEAAPAQDRPREVLLVFAASAGRRMAVPLHRVARLEEVPGAAVERAANREVMQYRGELLPLVRLAEHRDGPLQVVVCRADGAAEGRHVGLVVETVLDIVEAALDLKEVAPCPGVAGSAVIQQRVTDLLDVDEALRSVVPSWAPGGAA
jgi:two-component system chemotaxis sensor kinase CheA